MRESPTLSRDDFDAEECRCIRTATAERVWRKRATEVPGSPLVYFCDSCGHIYGYRTERLPTQPSGA